MLAYVFSFRLSGYHPFDVYGDTPEPDLIDNICRNRFNFDEPEWEGISEDGKAINSIGFPRSFPNNLHSQQKV